MAQKEGLKRGGALALLVEEALRARGYDLPAPEEKADVLMDPAGMTVPVERKPTLTDRIGRIEQHLGINDG